MEYSVKKEENEVEFPFNRNDSFDCPVDYRGNELSISYQNEYDYMPEYTKKQSRSNYAYQDFKKRPTNSLDYLKFQSEDYLRFKIEHKVRDRIKELNLGKNLEMQIFESCFNFYKKFQEKFDENLEKIRLFDLIPIVAYKFLKFYKIPIYDAIEKLKLDKGKYLKFSNQIRVGDVGNIVYKIEDECFKFEDEKVDEKFGDFFDKLFQSVSFMIQKLSEFFKNNPKCLQIQKNESLIDFYFTNFEKIENVHSKEKFFDNLKFLQEIKQEAKELIYAHSKIDKKDPFYDFFYNKIPVEQLSASIIKQLSDQKGIKIKLQTMRDNFHISISGISRGIKMLKEYFKFLIKCKK